MSVTILCPNGRRQTLKVTPNTTLSEILQSICEKHNLDANQYDLFRNNKPLDLSLTFRFSNIPNNGQIDLKAVPPKKTDQKVTLAIDLAIDSVERKIGDFDPNQCLWEIINILFEGNSNLNLKNNEEFCLIYMRKEIAGDQLKTTNLKSLGLMNGKAALKLIVRPIVAVKEQAHVEDLNLKKPTETKILEVKEKNVVSPNVNSVDESMQQSCSDENPTIKQSDVPEKCDTTPTPQSHSNDTTINDKIREDKNTDLQIKSDPNTFEKMEVESEESSDEGEEVLNYLGSDHSQVLFKISDLPKVSRIDYPDEFYQTTKDDIVKVLSDLKKQQEGNNDKMLETKQMREKRRREQMMKYKSTVVRVCFPYDKLVFQAIFKPNDTIKDVMRVLTDYLNVQDFNLYTVPPKHNLKPESTLLESELVPAALIHIGLDSSKSGQTVIKDQFKSKLSSYKSAAKVAANARKDTDETLVNLNQNQTLTAPTGQTSDSTGPRLNEQSTDQRETKIPKWFKTNK